MEFKRKLFPFMLLLVANVAMAQEDLILMRDGSELLAKVIQVDDKLVTYKENEKKNRRELYLDLKNVYMIRFKQRGNIYITAEGKRITGENDKWDKDADRIYLVAGREIQAYSLQIFEDRVVYSENKPSKKSAAIKSSISRDEVFMIKYKDGTRDILTNIQTMAKEKEQPQEEEEEVAEEGEGKEELQVVFHNVKRGETLNAIAKRYGVGVKDIITWNDLPKKITANSRLQSDMQLMIYVKPSKQ